MGNAAVGGRWKIGIDSSAAGNSATTIPTAPARISGAGMRRNSRSTLEAAVAVLRPKIPPTTKPMADPRKMPSASRLAVTSPVRVATVHPAMAKRATQIKRTNSTSSPPRRGRGPPESPLFSSSVSTSAFLSHGRPGSWSSRAQASRGRATRPSLRYRDIGNGA